MFCRHCGTENADGANFCRSCGKPLNDVKVETSEVKTEETVTESKPEGKAEEKVQKEKKPLPIKAIIAAVVAVVALVVIICVASVSGKTIDLNEYLTVESYGCDGYGNAKVTVDWEAIEKKYGSKLRFKSEAKKEFGEWLALVKPIEAVEGSVEVSLDRTSGLSNGDVIHYTWSIDEDINDYVNCRLKYKDKDFKVQGLTEVTTFDGFEGVTLEFTGVAPNGQATLTCTNQVLNDSDYTLDKTSGLSNGDVVTVTIRESMIEFLGSNEARVPEEAAKTFTVEGLESYVTDHDQIDAESLEAMQKQASDTFQSYVAQKWDENVKLEGYGYIGNYLLVSKGAAGWGPQNSLYLVYKAASSQHYSYNDEEYNGMTDIFWYIRYDNLKVGADGKVMFDVTDYSVPDDRFTVDSGISDGWWSTKCWYYTGYQTLEDLYNNVVSANLELYECYDYIDQAQAQVVVTVPETEADGEVLAVDNGYVLANSDTELLKEEDLEGLSEEQCKIARNEIYARHGRQFNDEALQVYFDACDWYEGTISPDDFDEESLSEIEVANRDLIVEYEKKMGYRH